MAAFVGAAAAPLAGTTACLAPATCASRSSAFVGAAAAAAAMAPGGARLPARPFSVGGASSVRMAAEEVDFDALGEQFAAEGKSPVEVIDHALTTFPGQVAIAFSGAEDVVLIEYAHRTGKPFRVFALDTGRLHAETYKFFAKVEAHYGIRIEYTFPDSGEVEALVNEKGLFSFYEDGHQECCRVRKVRPLRKKLSTLAAWITGQRKDQSPGTRTAVPVVQTDPAFKGIGDSTLIKYNPLSDVSSEQVWATIRMTEVPYNELHNKGYISIGCEPCTRPVLPNQHEREGRWWWEEATQKECGLHKGNISTEAGAAQSADDFVADAVTGASVVLFTKTSCKYCSASKDLLNKLAISYTDVNAEVLENSADVRAALERKTGQTTVPNIFIGGRHVGGNAELQAAHKSGALTEMLAAVGITAAVTAK
ncbi:hypothetical protein MMPV_000745 [Pyropia vietnamensis]